MAAIPENSVGIVETRIIRVVEQAHPLKLVCGKSLAPIDVAYETYGTLNAQGDNTVLICHALSGNAHAAGFNSTSDQKPGWWDLMIGPGKAIDTNKYFVICSNFLGGCSRTTGPSSINPATQKPYGLDFPMITISDMVKVQKILLDKLGIKKLLAVTGGSIGGMQVLCWGAEYPDFVKSVIPIATTSHLGAQSIAFDAVGRNAILADPFFNNGDYSDQKGPDRGLGIARMIGHITYLSDESMREKFGRKLRTSEDYKYGFDSEFEVETYLDYKGQAFVERFDANSYLYITKASDYFDLEREYGSLQKAFANSTSRFLVVSFTSDWLFTPAQSKAIVNALLANGKDVSYCNIYSPYGHDAFLLEPQTLGSLVSGFLNAVYNPSLPENSRNSKKSKLHTTFERAKRTRVDYQLIESLIEPQTKVLDIGCGDGQLLAYLTADKNISGTGVELDQALVLESVKRGISIIHQDIELGLENCADKSFDYVILSQTVQTVKNPEKLLKELLRIGKKVIVSFPNFAHWTCRLQLFFLGRAPVTKQLPFHWYDTPNIHSLAIKDFNNFCKKIDVTIEKLIPLHEKHVTPVILLPNLRAQQAVYILSKPSPSI